MKKLLTILFAVALGLNLSAQVPDYVPTDGLVAWYPLDGEVTDFGPNELDGVNSGANASQNRFGQAACAMHFNGQSFIQLPSENFPNGLTVSLWVKEDEVSGIHGFLSKYDGDNGAGDNSIERTFNLYRHGGGNAFKYYMTASSSGVENTDVPSISSATTDWVHIAAVFGDETLQFFVNGELDIAHDADLDNGYYESDVPLIVGGGYPPLDDPNKLRGDMDDLGIWGRTLTEEEILGLYNAEPPLSGCTDPTACNFDSEATSDDGSCIPSGCMDSEACNYNALAECEGEECNYLPELDLGSTITLCEGQTAVLGVDTSEFDVLWSNGSDSSSIEIGQTGTYWVQVGSANETDYRLEFDGVDDYVSFGNSLNITEYPFSIQLDATVSQGGFSMHTDDGTDGYSGVWMELNSTNMGVSVGSGWGGGPGQRRSKIASHGKQPGELVTVTAVVSGATDMSLYLDGVDVGGTYSGYGNTTFVDNGLDAVIGRYTASSGPLVNQLIYRTGSTDNLHVWTKALTAEEAATFATTSAIGSEEDLLALYTFDEGGGAVTVDDAQGFEANLFGNPTWILENSGCVASDTVAVYFIDCQNVCGPGTYWDETELSCLPSPSCQEDLDGDGVIGINDLMELLSSFGTMCEEPETGEFTCGDPMNYHGYDYATVQIGEQCWFAENLRSELYQNGDAIAGQLTVADWTTTEEGASAVYGESDDCVNHAPLIDACDSAQALIEYGRLYNGYAVIDSRGLCPVDWSIPNNSSWQSLITFAGGTSVAGGFLKADTGWSGSGNGTNSFGFAGKPGGDRNINGDFVESGHDGDWWTSSSNGTSVLVWEMYHLNSSINQLTGPLASGFSIRCLKD